MKVDELNDLDLSSTPPLSNPWNPVQVSAQASVKAQRQPQYMIHNQVADIANCPLAKNATDINYDNF